MMMTIYIIYMTEIMIKVKIELNVLLINTVMLDVGFLYGTMIATCSFVSGSR